jgi:hypothetical protein
MQNMEVLRIGWLNTYWISFKPKKTFHSATTVVRADTWCCWKAWDIRIGKIVLISAQLTLVPIILSMIHVFRLLIVDCQNCLFIFFLQIFLNCAPRIVNNTFDPFFLNNFTLRSDVIWPEFRLNFADLAGTLI